MAVSSQAHCAVCLVSLVDRQMFFEVVMQPAVWLGIAQLETPEDADSFHRELLRAALDEKQLYLKKAGPPTQVLGDVCWTYE